MKTRNAALKFGRRRNDPDSRTWERPFLTSQRTIDRFVSWIDRLPGIIQLGLYPLVLVVSLLHVPFALTHAVISAIINRITSTELPELTREALLNAQHAVRLLE